MSPNLPPIAHELCLSTIWMGKAHGCLITIHPEASPDNAEWIQHVDLIRRLIARGEPFLGIVYTLGGFPNRAQRAMVTPLIKENPTLLTRSVVLNNNLIMRMAVRSIRFVNKNICSVQTHDTEGALAHLGHPMSNEELKAILDHGVHSLRQH